MRAPRRPKCGRRRAARRTTRRSPASAQLRHMKTAMMSLHMHEDKQVLQDGEDVCDMHSSALQQQRSSLQRARWHTVPYCRPPP